MKRIFVAALVVVGLGVALVATEQPDAHAQAKKSAKAAKKPAKKGAKGEKEKEEEKDSEKGDGEEEKEEAASAEGKAKDSKTDKSGAPKVVETKSQGDGGVKTYTFGPVEVEGRLKSPQVIYFLRRVRAEFAAGDLGHRSFMREMSDTRRNPALR